MNEGHNLNSPHDADDYLIEEEPGSDAGPSIMGDIADLIDDGKTYVEAELRYQKTRLAFSADRGKSGIIFVFGALAFVHLALIALVVGLVIALAPLLTIWGALGVVVGLLLLGAILLLLAARGKFMAIMRAFKEPDR